MTHAHLARWLGRQLAEWSPCPPAARLYGVTVNDPEGVADDRPGAARFIAVADGDPYELLALAGPGTVEQYDALGLVALGWAHRRVGCRPVLRLVMVVVVVGWSGAPAFHVRDLANGEEIEPGEATGELAAAAARVVRRAA